MSGINTTLCPRHSSDGETEDQQTQELKITTQCWAQESHLLLPGSAFPTRSDSGQFALRGERELSIEVILAAIINAASGCLKKLHQDCF